ncbi:hypothetical protein, partial [Exiguobacterium sp. s150]|uniref:hypothetical protein n=1 Tax=Exiguobacterium sp. s150 TaxID=2751221 RepID=UPI001BEAE69A
WYSVRTEWLSCPHSVAQKNAQVAHFKCNNQPYHNLLTSKYLSLFSTFNALFFTVVRQNQKY